MARATSSNIARRASRLFVVILRVVRSNREASLFAVAGLLGLGDCGQTGRFNAQAGRFTVRAGGFAARTGRFTAHAGRVTAYTGRVSAYTGRVGVYTGP